MSEKLVSAYSSGLETSVMIRRIKDYEVTVCVVGRSSPMSLHDFGLATYGASTTFDQTWSNGITELWSMPRVVAKARNREQSRQKVAAKATPQTLKTK